MNARQFTIPMLPVSKNLWQRWHWAKRQRVKEDWEAFVWALVNERPRMPRPLSSVTCHVIVFWDKRGPMPDHHNLEMAHECIADGLVKAGIIQDDSDLQYVRGSTQAFRGDGTTQVLLTWEEKA